MQFLKNKLTIVVNGQNNGLFGAFEKLIKRDLLLLIAVVLLVPKWSGAYQRPLQSDKKRPSFGVVLNEDGDLAFTSMDPKESERRFRANIDGHATVGVKTYVLCIGIGGEVMLYPTKVASSVGWRKTKYEDENEAWGSRIERARRGIAAGLDALQIAGTQAKKNNMFFIPSLRMNDSHFVTDPYHYPLTGQFWLDHTNLTIKESPFSWTENYNVLLDYRHEEVRNFRLAQITEVIERNGNHIDGFELDFTRTHVLFSKGQADEGAPLMTEFVRKVKSKLNALSKKQGRSMSLFVRIPSSEEACKLAGIDIHTWIKERLVNVVSPAQIMTLSQDMPIVNLTKLAHQYGVQMYPSLFPRTSFRVPLNPGAADLGMKDDISRDVSVAEALGAAANYRWMGADGLYLFNYYGFPHPQTMYPIVAGLNSNKENFSDKVFAVTKAYFSDNLLPTYSYVKQLPKKISDSTKFTLTIGEQPEKAPFSLSRCVLRLGVKGAGESMVKVKINGHVLNLVRDINHLMQNKGKALSEDMADRSLIYPINDLSHLQKGKNAIELIANDVTITDIEVGYTYDNNLFKIVIGSKPLILNGDLLVK
jgi:hypothetical protein